MNVLSFLITGAILVAIITLIIWVGIYIALPIILFMLVVSAIGSIIKAFTSPKTNTAYHHHTARKAKDEKIIDVEFKEVK